jgi:hypothetical protein
VIPIPHSSPIPLVKGRFPMVSSVPPQLALCSRATIPPQVVFPFLSRRLEPLV